MKKTLDLVLKSKWYDMITSGEKREEYREIKTYWENRLMCQPNFGCGAGRMCKQVRECIARCERFTNVRFRRGYTSKVMIFEIESITIGKGKPEWGTPYHDVFIIKLGQKIKTSED